MAKHPLAAFETEQALRAAFEPAEGVAEDTTKRRKWRKWLVEKKCILVLAQPLKLVQLTAVRLMDLPLTTFTERLVAGARGRLPPS